VIIQNYFNKSSIPQDFEFLSINYIKTLNKDYDGIASYICLINKKSIISQSLALY
jgi:hypothetical protein